MHACMHTYIHTYMDKAAEALNYGPLRPSLGGGQPADAGPLSEAGGSL